METKFKNTKELINDIAYNTKNGNTYIYLKSNKYKRKLLYSNGLKYFIKNNGNIFFNNENDIKRINDFLK